MKMENPHFENAKKKAKSVLEDNSKIQAILSAIGQKLSAGGISFARIADKVQLLVRMVKAYVSGEYKIIPWKSIIVITAVLIYFLMPLDLIADFIPVTGYLDDFTLILWVFNHLQDDINTFMVWEQNGSL